ncbi:Retrovirus-related Pol polyprotein from transposon TNT 1-94 [Sesamum angolense]|uniref:Retrovirus-related Pol polyprotein from transposon TNT 1-94 n=1 Tax=Sesamum angolense TaxID=2727404 RepID=A0AAE1WAP6_9LAMI|nr:Retrovirus-related Pol polyprotein from transposon TNT 1-94 [Sesamum angolense]
MIIHDRGGVYLSGEFQDRLKENGKVSYWTPPGTPQLNGVVEMRNRSVLDMVRSKMNFTELSCPSGIMRLSRWLVFLERGYIADTRRDELLLEESNEASQSNAGISSAPTIFTNNVPVLRRSARVPQPPERIYSATWVDFEETFSLVAMAKPIRIMLAITVWYDYKIWQMDVKTIFLNGFVEEEIYMDQPEEFTVIGEEQKNDFDPCVYKKVSESSIAFLVLYVDDILLIGNDVKMLGTLKHGYPLNSP